MRRRAVPPSLAAALVLVAACGTVAAPAASGPSLELPGDHPAVDARAVLAAGVITDEGGSPVAGAVVAVYAYPTEIPEEVGEEFSLTEIGSATTDASGAYRIVPDYSVLDPVLGEELSEATEPVPVNLDIVAMADDAVGQWATTVWVSPDLEGAVVEAGSVHPDPAVRRLATTPDLDEATTPIFDIQLFPTGEGG